MTKARARYLLNRSIAFEDAVLKVDNGLYLVGSKKEGKSSYKVSRRDGCECVGYREKGECRHFVRVAWELQGRPVLA